MPASETIDVQQKGGDPVLFWNLCLFYEKPNAYLGVGKEAITACLLCGRAMCRFCAEQSVKPAPHRDDTREALLPHFGRSKTRETF